MYILHYGEYMTNIIAIFMIMIIFHKKYYVIILLQKGDKMTFVFILVVAFTLTVSSHKTKSSNSDIYGVRDNRIYFFLLIGSVIFDLVMVKIPSFNINILVYVVAGVVEAVFCIVINSKREKEIEKRHSLIKQVVQCLAPVRRGNELDKDLDNHIEDDLGFTLKYDNKGNIEEIKCDMDDPTKWSDDIITRIVFNLNKFIPTKQWVSHPDFPKLECVFEGTKLPPNIAKYPGSFLRPNNLIPIGVNGLGELSWNLGVKSSEAGDSLFVYEDGTRAQTIIPAKAPQALVGGSTGGGKAIDNEQKVYVLLNNDTAVESHVK